MIGRTNTTEHYEITFDNGDSYVDKCRASIGGFQNLLERAAARVGAESVSSLGDPDGRHWRAGDHCFTVTPVVKL